MSTALSTIQDPVSFVTGLGKSFAESQMFGCKTVAQGHVFALHCLVEGVSPLTIMQTYHLIEGKLSMRADAMLGRFIESGGWYRVLSRTSDMAEIEASAKRDGQPVKFSMTWEDAQKEPFTRGKDGAIKSNWSTPRMRMQMLWARVASDMVRTLAPQVVCGLYTPEEIDSDESPAAPIDAEVVASQPAEAKRTRKPKEAPAEPAPAVTPAAPVDQGKSIAEVAATVEAPAAQVVDVVAEPVKPAAAPALPQKVIDIIDLRDVVGGMWDPKHKSGPWDQLWPKVLASLAIPAGESDEERLVKASDLVRERLLKWLTDQKTTLDKINQSRELNTWANQDPTKAAGTTA